MAKKIISNLILFVLCGFIYNIIEILWRGYTHWSMFFLSGTCVVLINLFLLNFECRWPVFVRCMLGGIMITALEFITGCVVNIGLKMNVWDYSMVKFNILGQICPVNTCFWIILTLPILFFCDIVNKIMKI